MGRFSVTAWAFKEGVFKTPQGKYIARVKNNRGYVTLSIHDFKKDAEKAYEYFYTGENKR